MDASSQAESNMKKDHKYFHETMHKAEIERYEIIHDDSGFWIHFEK